MKTSELIGPALDWAVLEALGAYSDYVSWREQVGDPVLPKMEWLKRLGGSPSAEHSRGGHLIEIAGINLRPCYSGGVRRTGEDAWKADIDFVNKRLTLGAYTQYGPTSLIAALRCFVASKLGDEVKIPEELL